MGTGGGFRMILDGKSLFIGQFQAGQGAIIQMNMRHYYIGIFMKILLIYYETMILGGNFTFAGFQIFYGVVQTAMSMMHFIGGYAIG